MMKAKEVVPFLEAGIAVYYNDRFTGEEKVIECPNRSGKIIRNRGDYDI